MKQCCCYTTFAVAEVADVVFRSARSDIRDAEQACVLICNQWSTICDPVMVANPLHAVTGMPGQNLIAALLTS